MSNTSAISVSNLCHRYGQRIAIDDLSLEVDSQQIFVLVGPNGSGKSTLFRILTTLVPLQEGDVRILGHPLATHADRIRQHCGIVFQSPSVDRQLTVWENMGQQAALYAMPRATWRPKAEALLRRMRVDDRRNEYVETLSGGLRRRVELAKCLLHSPKLILMDEPSTGLDPGARIDLWEQLRQLQADEQVTVILTTHLLEEAEKADRLAILNEGRLVVSDSPANLRNSLSGRVITIQGDDLPAMARWLKETLSLQPAVFDQEIRIDSPEAPQHVAEIMDRWGNGVQSIRLAQPTLEDVFVQRTGTGYWSADEVAEESP